MNKTIDKKVADTIDKENQKLSDKQKYNHKVVSDLDRIVGNEASSYTIVPKDTIGRSIRYNVARRH